MFNPFESLSNKVALITGGAQGIGAGIASLFAEVGMQVLITDIADAHGAATVADITAAGGRASYLHCDVSKAVQIEAAVQHAISTHGRLDVVVNNAYWSIVKDVVRLPEDEWDKGMAVMLKSAYLFGKHTFPHMLAQGGGAMVNICSVHALASVPRYPVYAAAKAGLLHLTKQMAIDGAPHNIRINAICPGAIINRPGQVSPARRDLLNIPARRFGVPRDIAKAALFLISDLASYVTGHALVVDGGMTIQLADSVHWSGSKLAFNDAPDE